MNTIWNITVAAAPFITGVAIGVLLFSPIQY